MRRAFRGLCLCACLGLCAAPRLARAEDASIGPDKPLHFGASALLSLSGYTLAVALDAGPALRFGSSFALPLAAGLGKEGFDAAFGGDPSRADLAWDLLGIMAGLVVVRVLEELLFAPSPAELTRRQSTRASSARGHAALEAHFFLVKYRPNGSEASRFSRW